MTVNASTIERRLRSAYFDRISMPAKSVLVLIKYRYKYARRIHTFTDSIMISVDSSNEIIPEFNRIMTSLLRQAEMIWYLPQNAERTFDYGQAKTQLYS